MKAFCNIAAFASLLLWLWLGAINASVAAPANYVIDPSHTYPSFEADHMGVSVWRGKFNRSTGHVLLDTSARTGSVEITIDLASVDFGHDEMNAQAVGANFFDVEQHPTATYRGELTRFKKGAPTRVKGELTLHGITRPVDLSINAFKCTEHPMLKRELCGADVTGTFARDQFGLDAGKAYGFNMDVNLRIQVEAVKAAEAD